MKKSIVCLTLAVFAMASAVQAGESKGSAENKTAEKAKVASQKAAPAEKAECCEKGECSSKETFTKKAVKPVEKGATFLAKR